MSAPVKRSETECDSRKGKHTAKVAQFDCFFCDHCRQYVYDELNGDAGRGIPPCTWVESLPPLWKCPVCGSSADELRAATLFDDFSEDEFAKSGSKVS